jgi:hypothetical protein
MFINLWIAHDHSKSCLPKLQILPLYSGFDSHRILTFVNKIPIYLANKLIIIALQIEKEADNFSGTLKASPDVLFHRLQPEQRIPVHREQCSVTSKRSNR